MRKSRMLATLAMCVAFLGTSATVYAEEVSVEENTPEIYIEETEDAKELMSWQYQDGDWVYSFSGGYGGTAIIHHYYGPQVEHLVIPDTVDGFTVTSIGDSAFEDCSYLKSVELPETIYFIDNAAFKNCTGLTEITIPEGTEKIRANAFYGCTSLTKVILPSTVKSIFDAFQNCSALVEINLPNGIEEISGAFANCTSLKQIEIPESVTEINGTFYGCSELTDIKLPQNLTAITGGAFFNCTSLAEINIPANTNIADMEWAFSYGGFNDNGEWNSELNTNIVIKAEEGSAAYNLAKEKEMTVVTKKEEPLVDFVTRMYTVALGRSAEAEGLSTWTRLLLNKEYDGAAIADGFINSAEFVNKNLSNEVYLDVLYKTFFDREADAAGKETWLTILANGNSRDFVLAGFVNSNEFDALCNSFGINRGTMVVDEAPAGEGVNGFVERLYSKVLGRSSDAEGINTWAGLIARGEMSAEDVSKSFFFSEEYTNKNAGNEEFVDTLYQTFMNRAADADGKAFWLSYLAGGMSREEVLEGFSRSVEFGEIVKSFGL